MSDRAVELTRLVRMAMKWWPLVAVALLVSMATSFAVTRRTAKEYDASAKLLVNTASATSLTADYTDSQSALMLAATVANMIDSHRVAGAVLHSTNLLLTESGLLAEIQATAAADTPIVSIDVHDASPQRASLLANAVASEIISLNQADQSTRYGNLKATLQSQIASASRRLDAYTTQLRLLSAKRSTDPARVAEVSSIANQIDTVQSSLTSLNTQLNTILLSQAQSDTTLTIIDSAQVPTAPIGPSLVRNELLAILLSLLISACIVAGAEYVNDSVRSPEFLQERLRLPVLATVGKLRLRKYATLVADRPWDTNVEAFKTLRTNVQFMNVDQPPRTILVGSGGPMEGKTTVAANFAVAVAQAGKRVIVVDCDLRRPTLHHYFGLEPSPGLTEYLSEPSLGLGVARVNAIPNLLVVSSGATPPNPSELLGSHRMTRFLRLLTEQADLVILDSAPALVVADASVLASQVDGVLLVVDEERSKLRSTVRTVERFTMVGGRVLGLVVNKFDPRSVGYGRYGHYYTSDQGGNSSHHTGEHLGYSAGHGHRELARTPVSRTTPRGSTEPDIGNENMTSGPVAAYADARSDRRPSRPGIVLRMLTWLKLG